MKKNQFRVWLKNFRYIKNLDELVEDIEREVDIKRVEISIEMKKNYAYKQDIITLKQTIEQSKNKIAELNKLLNARTSKNFELNEAIQDRNNQIQELHYEMSKIVLRLDKRDKRIKSLKEEIRCFKHDEKVNNSKIETLEKDKNNLNADIEILLKKIEYLKTKVPKKDIEYLKAYENGDHEVLKRIKESKKVKEAKNEVD